MLITLPFKAEERKILNPYSLQQHWKYQLIKNHANKGIVKARKDHEIRNCKIYRLLLDNI